MDTNPPTRYASSFSYVSAASHLDRHYSSTITRCPPDVEPPTKSCPFQSLPPISANASSDSIDTMLPPSPAHSPQFGGTQLYTPSFTARAHRPHLMQYDTLPFEYPPAIPVLLRHPEPSSNKNIGSPIIPHEVTRIDNKPGSGSNHVSGKAHSMSSVQSKQVGQVRRRRRPPYSYCSLIAQAILQSPNQQLTLREVYEFVSNKYPALYDAKDSGWQNTIRHNLSLNKCFKKVPRSFEASSGRDRQGKGCYWTIDPQYFHLLTKNIASVSHNPELSAVISQKFMSLSHPKPTSPYSCDQIRMPTPISTTSSASLTDPHRLPALSLPPVSSLTKGSQDNNALQWVYPNNVSRSNEDQRQLNAIHSQMRL
ncbi:uncharacterized protein VTP21DRAFT_9342 [Calcarisporiella thermophila]|uniref:uncharacterized protein n=1 Tax=Calcarisporiella thermophila TaxID=911321 RepID=UPI0037424BA8